MNNNIKKKLTWKNWLIRRLLSSESAREEVLSFHEKRLRKILSDSLNFQDAMRSIRDNPENHGDIMVGSTELNKDALEKCSLSIVND